MLISSKPHQVILSQWQTQHTGTSFLCGTLQICHFDSKRTQIHFGVKRPVHGLLLSRKQEMLKNKAERSLTREARQTEGEEVPLLQLNRRKRDFR